MSQILAGTPYEVIGAEAGVRLLVQRFYDIMDSDPVAAGVRAAHSADLSEARERLYLFLVGWMGGPALYVEKHGHPMLRARHLPFRIDERMRDEWLYCMYKAMDEQLGDRPALKLHLEQAFMRTADFMRNCR
ncbi:group II truncated hemoglobin [Chitinimonas arctica]|uniref:Group II truncated hemoglobin n=1 Tax=Chitinimonas arctica TaxID=2594795 RepID=A0A516SKV8_9NEIS|nr:group II truncated hemoglobin [Chitinimonas arctica]QDQ28786.1 group II truncated hemoglobin [Chitinimonas arctica]